MGNLRTALFAWLFARSTGRSFVMRVEDLDRVQEGAAQRQLDDLASLGIDWDGEVIWQSERLEAHRDAVENLRERGVVYECFCTRKEIQQAASAPHAAPGAYPGTCRHLTDSEREERRAVRPPALRLAADIREFTVQDYYAGEYTGAVDDFVLVRNDGKPAYNLAAVVDDAFSTVDQVVRGDDLLSSAPRQAYLASLLGLTVPAYAHVPLALNVEGKRLAKRDGAVTLVQLRAAGISTDQVMHMISSSIPLRSWCGQGGFHLPRTASQMLEVFDPDAISLQPWVVIDPAFESVCCA
nr:tRNA glutamyl-Q(34) synthetase GluQRS [Rothia sp. ZJ1223]